MPYGQKSTLYDALGLNRDAKQSDIIRTYRRLTQELQKESAAPDPRREALVHEAYEVLSDPQRRAAYDKSLRDEKFLGVQAGRKPGFKWGAVVGAVALALGGAYYYFRAAGPAPGAAQLPGASLQVVQAAAAVAIGRVSQVQMSGARSNLGAAVAIAEGVMMTPCQGIAPGAQLMVRIPPRDIPAQVRQADDTSGLCRLLVSGGASWPLTLSRNVPRVGDTVYAANLGSLGEVVLGPGEVKKIAPGGQGMLVDTNARAGEPVEGTPLLDNQGQLVAIVLNGRYTTLPGTWMSAPKGL